MGASQSDLGRALKRLAYVRQALAITTRQEAAWEGYANSVTTVARRRSLSAGIVNDFPRRPTAPDQMRRRISDVENLLAGLKTIEPFERGLYDALTDNQQALADRLVSLNCVAWDTGN
ncbi:hypothetical protein MMA231_03702 (plasmid) [Asticcacaulis sp. MM231]